MVIISRCKTDFRACLHGGGGPRAGEVRPPRWGSPPLHINSHFFLDRVYMIGGVTRLGGLPGLLGRVTLPGGVAFCHVNVSRWGNPPTRGSVHVTKTRQIRTNNQTPAILEPQQHFSVSRISAWGAFFAGFICLVSKAAIKMAIRKNLKVFKFQVMLQVKARSKHALLLYLEISR